jgi:signal transduction histidine kinase
MLRFRSIRTRVIVFTTLPLIAILVAIVVSTATTANRAVRTSVHKSLTEAGSVFVRMLTTRKSELVSMAQVTVRDPRFFATFSIPESERGEEFKPTLEGIAVDFLRITDADFLEVFDADGNFIMGVDRDRVVHAAAVESPQGTVGLKQAMKGSTVADFYAADDHLVVAALSPIYVQHRLEAVLRLGSYLDRDFVEDVKRLTGAEVWLARGDVEYSSTYPLSGIIDDTAVTAARHSAPATLSNESVTLSDVFSLPLRSDEYLTIHVRVTGVDPLDGFDAYIGRELHAELRPMIRLERRLAVGGILAVLVTLLVGYIVASGVTRPVKTIVDASVAMREGRYDYPIEIRGNDELTVLARNFAEMRDSLRDYVQHLENIDHAKSNFIALAGHELRTPLTIITGFNEMISSGALGEVPKKVEETTHLITEQLTDLNGLVQSMLDLLYLEQGLEALSFAPVEARALVESVLSERREALAARRLNLRVDPGGDDAVVHADRQRLREAVFHLLDNAIRFTPDGGTLGVSVACVRDRVRIAVTDSGIGIPPNEIKWIFGKIYEVGDIMHHSSGKHRFGSRGFGLGLALCKAIVDAHGGEIDVASAPGRGSTFTIVLPTHRSDDTRATPNPSNPSHARSETEGALV